MFVDKTIEATRLESIRREKSNCSSHCQFCSQALRHYEVYELRKSSVE